MSGLTPSCRRVGSLIACGIAAAAIGATMAGANSGSLGGQPLQLITEHSLGQQGPASTAQSCRQFDPWAYRLLCSGVSSRVSGLTTRRDSPASQVVRPTGFDWRDASIGAATALGLVLFFGVAGTFAVRRRRTVAHVSS